MDSPYLQRRYLLSFEARRLPHIFTDVLVVGAGAAAPEHIRQMLQWGVAFDKDVGGELSLGREGGHSAHRIVHADGDATGKAMIDVLLARATATENLKVWDYCF